MDDNDKKLIGVCITIIVCVCIICFTVYALNNNSSANNTTPDNTTNNTANVTNNTTLNDTDDNSNQSSASTGSNKKKNTGKTNTKSSSSSDSNIEKGYSDGSWNDVPVIDSSGKKTVRGQWIGRTKDTGTNVYKTKDGRLITDYSYIS